MITKEEQLKMRAHSHNLSNKEIKEFQEHILSWFVQNKRDFPWRHTRDPYKILVSEVMSQQTQILRVVPKYENWLQAFPTLNDLAKAPVREVLRHWSGLGYNRRALYLQKCAEEIVQRYRGKFPRDEKTLLSLPGIGKYTARAVLSFAFNKQVAVVDTNIKKVILTQFFKGQTLSEKEFEEFAEKLLPHGHAYEWNQALMDYAGLMLKKEKIRIPKQSKFKDSDRYVRGQIIKLLLSFHVLSTKQLHHTLSEQMALEKTRFLAIVADLTKEGMVLEKEGMLTLP